MSKLLMPFIVVLLCAISCAKRPEIKPQAAAPSIIEQLSSKEVELSLDVGQATGELSELPAVIQVRYTNKSSRRGYCQLPSPPRGKPNSEYGPPALGIGMRQTREGGISPSELIFLYAPAADKKSPRPSVAILEPNASISIDYPLEAFCMIGHGIAPDPNTNLRTSFKPGDIPTELRAYLITDWNNPTQAASSPVTAKLSEPDISGHRDLQQPTK